MDRTGLDGASCEISWKSRAIWHLPAASTPEQELTNNSNQSAKLDSPSPTQTIGRLSRQQSAKERPTRKDGNHRASDARVGPVEVAVELVIAVRNDGSDDSTV
jgi:hypothetical protein